MVRDGSKANLETARDLASLAVAGGVLLVGVRDKPTTGDDVVGVALDGLEVLGDRLAQVAVARIDPPLNIVTQALPDPADPRRGVLVVTVPASLTAPHMVDGAYWGRSSTGKRTLADGEVRLLLHERDRRASSFRDDLRALPGELSRISPSVRQHAHAHLLLRPAVSTGSALLDAIDDGGTLREYVRKALTFDPQFAPTLTGAQQGTPHPDGWELTTGADSEDWSLRLVLEEDGAINVFAGHVSFTDTSNAETRRYISPGMVAELTHSAIELAGFIGAHVLHYPGIWHLGVLLDGLKGLPPTPGRRSFRMSNLGYPEDDYLRDTEASTGELNAAPADVVRRLLRSFTRGLGTPGVLDYSHPSQISERA